MKNSILLLLLITVFSCKEKKPDLSGNTNLKAEEFFNVFKLIKLPTTIADTSMLRLADTVKIGYKALLQFVPDSALKQVIPDAKKTTIHPFGRIQNEKEKDAEIYLLANVTSKGKTSLYVFVFNKTHKYLNKKEVLKDKHDDNYSHTVSINREPTFVEGKERTEGDQLKYTRIGWAFIESTNHFMVVINDGNENTVKNEKIINPIDTLPRKNQLSGDYQQDKKNFISIRDGKNANTYEFFIHFEKNEGSCTGELKGEMKIISAKHGQYKANGDACVIDFTFNGNEISFKEQGICGNHRGIKCQFNDSYIKKREPKKKKK